LPRAFAARSRHRLRTHRLAPTRDAAPAFARATRGGARNERGGTDMIDDDFEALRGMGLTPALAQRAAGFCDAAPGAKLVRVTEVHRDSVCVHDGRVEGAARALPRLLRALADEAAVLAVGDWVLARDDRHGGRWIEARVPPVSRIDRRDEQGRRQPIVCNVDVAMLVMGLDGDFNARRLERYLALVRGEGVLPVVVLTKADVAAPDAPSLAARLSALAGRVPAHVDVLAVDATAPSTADRLAPYATQGSTLVLLGSSGAGKSTLTNTLLGANVQDTGGVRAGDSRGRHTTTARSLHRLPGGACVIDTPGLRALRPDLDEAALAATFDDIDALAARCRFADCRHAGEPGCAVREGVPADRLGNYHKMLRDARRDTMSALERQREVAQWKARGKAARARIRQKRGEE
jgi:ribosome biogenesis GTPase